MAEEVLKRSWEFACHGEKANFGRSSTMSEADKKAYIEDCSAAFKTATGIAPRGWLEPGNAEPSGTLPLVSAAGYDYTLD